MNKMKTEIPNDCGVVAVLEAHRLFKAEGVASRILMFTSPDMEEAHAALVYETPRGGVMVYDADGSRDLSISPKASALDIARRAFGSKVSAAYFYGGLQRTLESISRNRQLSPQELRDHRPRLARLLELEDDPPTGRRLSPAEIRGRPLFNL
jgi:hypothetical protein